jgi:hypothetical protein
MATFISVYHSGVVITNEIGSYEFVGMKNETFLLNEFLTHANVVIWCVSGWVGWMRVVKSSLNVALISGRAMAPG